MQSAATGDTVNDGTVAGDTVELVVPASATYVGPLRVLAAALAARCDLTIDEIEDLRLAVDEACALILPHAVDASLLTARFKLSAQAIGFTASVVTKATSEPDQDGFSWSILSALAEDLQVQASATALSISFGKSREAPTGAA
jgi:serine/threonine-protein kinase RsbW